MFRKKIICFQHSSQEYQQIGMKNIDLIASRLQLIFPEISGKFTTLESTRQLNASIGIQHLHKRTHTILTSDLKPFSAMPIHMVISVTSFIKILSLSTEISHYVKQMLQTMDGRQMDDLKTYCLHHRFFGGDKNSLSLSLVRFNVPLNT